MPPTSLAADDTVTRMAVDPAVARIRLAVRGALAGLDTPVAVVALSGGADSLALAAAVAFEAPRRAVRAVAVTVDHGLQPDSAAIARRAADAAASLGLDARVVRVEVGGAGGPEAAARDARYAALRAEALRAGAGAVLLAHTLDDQAETVLLGLARGSGAASLAGMSADREEGGIRWLRPLLPVPRATTRAACAAAGLDPWDDPHNHDPAYARVRVRDRVLPVLEAELGPGIAAALARTADQLAEDAAAFDAIVAELLPDLVTPIPGGVALPAAALAANPAALRHRIIRAAAAAQFEVVLTRTQTLEVARLVTEWHGQGPIDLPGCRARRVAGRIELTAASS